MKFPALLEHWLRRLLISLTGLGAHLDIAQSPLPHAPRMNRLPDADASPPRAVGAMGNAPSVTSGYCRYPEGHDGPCVAE